MSAVKLAVRDVKKTFRVRGSSRAEDSLLNVLGGVSFDTRDGEIVSLIGESGCGKTTLLRIIQGLTKLDAGTVAIDGVPITGPGRNRGLVFQQPNLLPWRSALANVEFGMELMSLPNAERHERAKALLELVGLSQSANQFPHQLSGGMQQRVGLARALVRQPEVLLMDEPFGALDAQTRTVMQDELLGLWSRVQSTVLFITHDLDEAIYLSDQVVIMGRRPGRIKQVLQVNLPRPRYSYDPRAEPEFARLRNIAWQSIKEEL
jgi:NitT/TauT family transport system ATP-binding protein